MIFPFNKNNKLDNNSITSPVYILGIDLFHNDFGLHRETRLELKVYLCVRTCEVFLCFVAIVRVRVCYVDFFVFFVLRH